MNSLLNILGGMGAEAGGTSILLQALGAAMRGEDAKTWMRNLAKKDPRLKRVNLEDLYGSAQALAKENGMNVDDVTKQIDQTFAPHMK